MRYSFVGLLLLLLSGAGFAQTTVPFTFTAGTAAKASEVNADFQALATAIDNLASRLDKIDGALTVADVAGTYSLVSLQVGSSATGSAANTQGSALQRVGNGTVTLNANGSFTFSQTFSKSSLIVQFNGLGGSATATTTSNTDSGMGTWSLSGNILTLNSIPFTRAAGSRLFMNVSDSGVSDTPLGANFLIRN